MGDRNTQSAQDALDYASGAPESERPNCALAWPSANKLNISARGARLLDDLGKQRAVDVPSSRWAIVEARHFKDIKQLAAQRKPRCCAFRTDIDADDRSLIAKWGVIIFRTFSYQAERFGSPACRQRSRVSS
jgi:hypothetical protein